MHSNSDFRQIQKLKQDLMKLLENRDPKALNYIEMLENKGAETADIDLIGYSYYRYAYYYYFTNQDILKFRKNVSEAIKYLLRSKDKEYLAGAYNLVAYDAVDQGVYDIAYAYFVMALDLLRDRHDIALPGIIEANAGRILIELGEYEDGYARMEDALNRITPFTNVHVYNYNIILTYAEMALTAFKLKDANRISKAMENAEKYHELASDEEVELSETYYLLIGVYHALLSNDEELIDESLAKLYQTWTDPDDYDFTGIIYEIESICSYMMDNGFFKQAEELLDKTSSLEKNENIKVVMQYIAMKILYFERVDNEEKFREYLLKRHRARKLEKSNALRVRRYSMDFSDMVSQIAKERAQYISK